MAGLTPTTLCGFMTLQETAGQASTGACSSCRLDLWMASVVQKRSARFFFFLLVQEKCERNMDAKLGHKPQACFSLFLVSANNFLKGILVLLK